MRMKKRYKYPLLLITLTCMGLFGKVYNLSWFYYGAIGGAFSLGISFTMDLIRGWDKELAQDKMKIYERILFKMSKCKKN